MILPTTQHGFKLTSIAGTNRYQLEKLYSTDSNEIFVELFALKSDIFSFNEESEGLLSGYSRKLLKHKHSQYTSFEVAFETYLPNCCFGVVSSTLNTSDAILYHEFEEGAYRIFIYEGMVLQTLQLLLMLLDGDNKANELNQFTFKIAG